MMVKNDQDFFLLFDEKNGFYLRSGIIENGRDTGIDPFMASFPELLDVGIMGRYVYGKTGLCLAAGVQCCQRGLDSVRPNMRLEDFRWITEQCARYCGAAAVSWSGGTAFRKASTRPCSCCTGPLGLGLPTLRCLLAALTIRT